MSDTNNTKTVTSPTPAEVTGQAPAEAKAQAGAGAELTVQDLTVIRSIIDVASQRGAFKANEMAAVGTTFNKLDGFLKIVEKSQKDAKVPTEGDKKEAEKKKWLK